MLKNVLKPELGGVTGTVTHISLYQDPPFRFLRNEGTPLPLGRAFSLNSSTAFKEYLIFKNF